jgi:signal transduction histidine kinase
MLRIRSQLALLTVGLVGAASIGALFFSTRVFVLDKQAYVRDLHSVTAPAIAQTLSGTLDHLVDQLSAFDDVILSLKESQKSGILVQNAFSRLASRYGVTELNVLDEKDQSVILSIASDDKHMEFKAGPQQAAECKAGRRLYRPLPKNSLFAMGVWIRSRFYWIWLKPEAFQEELSRVAAFSPMVVDLQGQLIFGSGQSQSSTGSLGNQPWLKPLLAKAAQQTLLAEEVTFDSGDLERDVLAVLAALPNTSGALLVLTTEGAQVSEMAMQGVLAVLPFLAVTLFASIGIAWFLAIRLARPIEELTSATAKIASGEWGVRLGVGGTQEVRALIDAFVKMGQELRQREAALNRAHDDLRRSEQLALLGKFSAGIAHEIKNPLSSILGYCQLLQKRLKENEDPNVQKFLGFAMDETRRASRIITDLLTFSRQKPPILAETRLEEVVAYAFELLQPQAQQSRVKLIVEQSLSPLPVRLDRDQYFQVILNLVTNAFQALEGKPEGEPREVKLTTEIQGDQAILRIRDNGTGITPENMAKLFQPFFSTKGVGKGTGLGLSLCLGIIQQHQGKIEAKSELNQYTEFKISLPLIAPGAAPRTG